MEGFGQFMPIILLFLAMYFLFILPQSKKAKKEKNFIKNVPFFFGRLYWLSLFKEFNEGKHKTWDYTIVHDCLTKNLKCIKPTAVLEMRAKRG